MNGADHTRMLAMRQHILDALTAEAGHRREHEDWVHRERLAVAVAGNAWAQAHALTRRVTVADVERLERPALGHSDYAAKVALYVAESLFGVVPGSLFDEETA